MSEPIVCASQWRTVMEAAGYRCQCRGACGAKHAKSEGRCPREHDQYADKHHGPVRLIAAPTDPTTGIRAATALPTAALRAWCPTCHTAASRAARKAARADPDPQQAGLFDLVHASTNGGGSLTPTSGAAARAVDTPFRLDATGVLPC